MGTEQELPLSRILEIAEGVSLIGDNALLDGIITYRLGRLADYTKAPIKEYNKLRELKRKEILEKQRELQKKMKAADEDGKRELSMDIQGLSNSFNGEENITLLEQLEPIKIPELKLSDFLAKEERKIPHKVGVNEDQRTVELVLKPGQSLVPVKFFALMGDVIKDDKEALKVQPAPTA